VIAHPWFLCTDMAEMAEKAEALLLGMAPVEAMVPGNIARFRERFRWQDVLWKYLAQLVTLVQGGRHCQLVTAPPYVLVERIGAAESGDVIQALADNRDLQLVNVQWKEAVVGYVLEGTRPARPPQDAAELPHLILERLLDRVATNGSRVVLLLYAVDSNPTLRILWARARGFSVVVAAARPSAPMEDLADAVWPIAKNSTDDLARLLAKLR